ncbi:MAG: hypothetical protein L0Y71_19900 [Gemmataceae bacterium]|nr:hypothetical protein [Gemmataceae bacterium]
MQHQGPNGMGGPLRGTSVWWHGRTDKSEPCVAVAIEPAPPESQPPDSQPPELAAGIRLELVERVRREIAAGDYDTPARWEAALDRLLDRLNRE